jgi:hypothetical protein
LLASDPDGSSVEKRKGHALEPNRRRIDVVTDPVFVATLNTDTLQELRERRVLCDELDNELSYYRRLLHGRLDLLGFEKRRRSGAETRSLIEALPEILADSEGPTRETALKSLPIDTPDFLGDGHRAIDRVLGDDFLAHLPTLDDAELDEIEASLTVAERDISEQRRAVYDALALILEELTRRYREGLADVDELLEQG